MRSTKAACKLTGQSEMVPAELGEGRGFRLAASGACLRPAILLPLPITPDGPLDFRIEGIKGVVDRLSRPS